jgi:hypothetical protein
MSLDILVVCFRNGVPATFKREIFDKIFRPYYDHPEEREPDHGFVQVTFPDKSRSDIDIGYVGSDIDHVGFNHFGGDSLFDAMYQLADGTSSVICWPALRPSAAVTNEAVLKELSSVDFPDLKIVQIVHSGADIVEAIESSFKPS